MRAMVLNDSSSHLKHLIEVRCPQHALILSKLSGHCVNHILWPEIADVNGKLPRHYIAMLLAASCLCRFYPTSNMVECLGFAQHKK